MLQWIVIGIALVVIATALAVLVIVLLEERQRKHAQTQDWTGKWNVELWNISQGFCVNLMIHNTGVLGRYNLYAGLPADQMQAVDPTISREHCMLYDQNDSLWIWNMSAVNPTLVNGLRLNAPRQLIPGDRISMGQTTFLVTRVRRLGDGQTA